MLFPSNGSDLCRNYEFLASFRIKIRLKSGTFIFNLFISSFNLLHFSRDRNDIITLWTFSSPPLTYQSGSVVRLEVLVTSYTPLRIYMSPTGTSGPLEALSQPDLFGEQVRNCFESTYAKVHNPAPPLPHHFKKAVK